MAIQKLTSIEQLQLLLKENRTVLLLKNSITCPISHEAYSQFEKFADEIVDRTIYFLNVQESRDFSKTVAEMYSVKHESPQVLLFKDGNVAWHTSHWNITYKALKEQYSF